jgi:excisionase family DNA binding protein
MTESQRTENPRVDAAPFAEEFLTVREGAALLRLSEVSIRRYLTQKKLRRFKVGGRTLLMRSDVLGLVRRGVAGTICTILVHENHTP